MKDHAFTQASAGRRAEIRLGISGVSGRRFGVLFHGVINFQEDTYDRKTEKRKLKYCGILVCDAVKFGKELSTFRRILLTSSTTQKT